MNWQNVFVVILLLVAVIYLSRKMLNTITDKKPEGCGKCEPGKEKKVLANKIKKGI